MPSLHFHFPVLAAFFLSQAFALAALPPLNTPVFILPAGRNPNLQALRHCNYAASFDPYEGGSDDFSFTLVAALDHAPLPAASFRSVNFPTMYLTHSTVHPPAGRVGITVQPNVDTASFDLTPSPDGSSFIITTRSADPALHGRRLTVSANASGPCNTNARQKPDAVLSPPAGGALSQDFVITGVTPSPGPSPSPAPAPPPVPATIAVDASSIDHAVAEAVLGCHMDPGFGNDPMAWTSTLIYGQGFPTNEPAKVKAWHDVSTAAGSASLDSSVIMNAAANALAPGAPTLLLSKTGGAGIVGWGNRGIGGEGLVFAGNKDYEGYVMVLSPAGGSLIIAMVDRNANATLASTTLTLPPSPAWQRVPFAGLTPTAGTGCVGIPFGSDPTVDCGPAPKQGQNPGIVCVRCGGEVQVGLASVGTVHVGFVTLQPGAWGRFANLPALKSGTDMIQQMGFKSIRQGGSVSYSLSWKDWRGAPEQRAAMNHVWGPNLVAPWGPFELIDMANALNIKPIITLATDTPPSAPPNPHNTAADWADLVEYLYGDDTTPWGSVRIHNDSHPAPYMIDTFELGNEQTNDHFLEQLQAIEARRKTIPGAPEWNFMYPENSGPNATTMAAIIASGINPRRVTADCHVGASGGVSCAEKSVPWQFNGSGINCETNAVTSHLQRGVEEAADLITWFSQPANVSSRLIARTASFCIQRSGQMRDIWGACASVTVFDIRRASPPFFLPPNTQPPRTPPTSILADQGLSFFLPNMTWMQPPGVVHSLFSKYWTPNALRVAVAGGNNFVTAAAQVASDKSYVVVEMVNAEWGAVAGSASVTVSGFTPASAADFWLIAEPGAGAVNSTAGNTPANPDYIKAVRSSVTWPASGELKLVLPPLSVGVLVLRSA